MSQTRTPSGPGAVDDDQPPLGPLVRSGLQRWMLANQVQPAGPGSAEAQQHSTQSWWKVMCLTGVDYFSTLSYLPGIAALAAGALSPVATLLIVALTLLGMLPMYRRVAKESPHGQGSVAMLERLLPFWRGKVFVLVLLGFVVTSWLVTITLSAADASVHLIENPYTPEAFHGKNVLITVVLLLILGFVFLLGFNEAVVVAIPLVGAFLALNAAVVVAGIVQIVRQPEVINGWTAALEAQTSGPGGLITTAVIAFPLLVLGLSGFETGVSMMPLIKADGATPEQRMRSRVRNTRFLLTTAAAIMSVYLVATSLITTLLIPPAAFVDGGPANGRAIAYLAHGLMGEAFGTVYDLSSVLILWFAGASAMAGLINIVPRYLPAYGMAPDWGKAVRPVVVVYTVLSIVVTLAFRADVNAQAGAYATGILVMMFSGAFAVTISARRRGARRATVGFAVLTVVLLYALVANVVEKPDGIVISGLFILGIVAVSVVSRVRRSFELRATEVVLDRTAQLFLRDAARRTIRLVANEPNARDAAEYQEKRRDSLRDYGLDEDDDIIFVEITVTDPSGFASRLDVQGHVMHGHYRVLTMEGTNVPNALGALLLHVRDETKRRPHLYVEWTEGNPVANLARFLILGVGEVAPTTREVLRRAEPDRSKRPYVHTA
ncbi:Amino acid permease [Microlunatus sagamiharensis]|uniref:Amino acid permease n=1 Tax=Microlunatus sagamiharensis TaxID=546874 RepID=A0A1H2NC82_9ACTN|nr:amino acid transporter [Microlunatus sagamiharensis]SDV02781.1 Amino acid permease [Microlunatus sagamiharensis]